MASITVRHVPNPTAAEFVQYAEVCGAANGWHYPGGLNCKEIVHETFMGYLKGPVIANAGELHVAETADGRVVGVVVWIKPGFRFMDSEVQQSAGWDAVLRKLPPDSRDYCTNVFPPNWYRILDEAYGRDVLLSAYEPCNLSILSGPDLPPKDDIESKLVEFGEAKAIAAHAPCISHVPCISKHALDDVKRWEARGYTLVHEGVMPLLEKADGIPSLPYYCMIKHTESLT